MTVAKYATKACSATYVLSSSMVKIYRDIVGLWRVTGSFHDDFGKCLVRIIPELMLLLWTGVVYSSPHVTHADIK